MIIKINGLTISGLKQGFPLEERIDGELLTGTLVFYNTDSSSYTPNSTVELYITSDVTVDHYMKVDMDLCEEINRDTPKLYRHTVMLIDPTRESELYLVDDVAFTQPLTGVRYYLDDVLQRIIDITPLEKASKHSATRLFALDSSVASALSTIKAPQLFFSNQTVRQVGDDTLKYVNSILSISSYSSDKAVLGKKNLNGIATLISSMHTYKSKSNGSNSFFNLLDIRMANGISETVDIFPSEPNYITFTTHDYIMTTNDLILELPKPIYKVEKVLLLLKYVEGDINSAPTYHFEEVDITDRVYEQEAYNALLTSEKYGAVVYTQGGKSISGFGNSFPQFYGSFPTSVIQNIVGDNTPITWINPQGNSYTYINTPTLTGGMILAGDYGLRVYYKPYVSVRVQVQKSVPQVTNPYTVVANQSANLIDINRLLSNAQGTINRMGNGDMVIEVITTSYANRLRVGQYTSDGYIATSVENQVYNGLIRSKATLTKNYNRLSQYVGIDREYRQYQIPLNNTINRNLTYNEYIVVSNTLYGTDSTVSWINSAMEWVRNMFRSVAYGDNTQTITSVVVSPKLANSSVVGNFVMGLSKLWFKNGISFHFGFDNNLVAYKYPDTTTETFLTQLTTRLIPVKYTDDDGLFEWLSVKLINENSYKHVSELVRNVDSVASSNFTSIMGSYPNGLYHHLTVTPYTYTDPVSTNTYDYDYVLLKQDGGSFSVSPILEDDLLKMLVTGDDSSTSAVWLESTHNAIKRHREVSTVFMDSNYGYMKLDDLVVKKDPSEVISMTYTLSVVPNTPNIIIGELFMKHNPFMVVRTDLSGVQQEMYLYKSNSLTYRDGDLKAKGTPTALPFDGFTITGSGNYFIINITDVSGMVSWGIGDGEGNLYVGNNAVNGVLATTLYFQFRNKL